MRMPKNGEPREKLRFTMSGSLLLHNPVDPGFSPQLSSGSPHHEKVYLPPASSAEFAFMLPHLFIQDICCVSPVYLPLCALIATKLAGGTIFEWKVVLFWYSTLTIDSLLSSVSSFAFSGLI